MKYFLIKTEKALFYFLAFAAFWQLRLVWVPGEKVFNEWTAFSLYATDIIIAAIFILWLGRVKCKRRLAQNPSPPSLKGGCKIGSPPLGGAKGDFFYENITLGLFLLFCALSLFTAFDKVLAGYRFIKLLEFVGLYFYVRYNFAGFYGLKRFWQWFVAGALSQSVVAIAQFLTQKSLGLKFFAESPLASSFDGVAKIIVDGQKFIRAYGLVPHPNILAAMLVVALFGLVWLVIFRHSDPAVAGEESRGSVATRTADPAASTSLGLRMTIKNTLFIVIFVLLSVALFFTFSRGVIVVGGVLFLVWLAYLWRQRENRRIVFSIFLLFAICYSLSAIIYWPYVSARYDLTALPESQSVNLRFFYDQAALDFVKTNPWLGVGQGNFTVALREVLVLPGWQYQPAHNIYLLAAAETGLLSLLAFLVLLILTIRSAWRRIKESSVSCLLLIVFFLLLIGSFDHFLWDLQQGQILFWLMLGLLAGSRPRSSRLRSNYI